jgi:hypothetical protein
VPSTTPPGTYRLVVVANGIPSEPCRVTVTSKLIKELKFEIKEKFEIVEVNKRLLDVQKRPVEVDDKTIREDLELFERFEEDWLQSVRSLSAQFEEVQKTMSRSFIKPEERPDLPTPEPEIEPVEPRKLTEEEARIGQIKRAFNDGREEKGFTKEAEEIRDKVHNLSRQGRQDRTDEGKDQKKEKEKGEKDKRERPQ